MGLTVLIFFAAALALAFAAFNFAAVKKMPEGTERMSEISSAIRVGANAFINYEYRILAIVLVCIAAVMAIITTWHAAVALLIGAVMSASAGSIGMKIATYANVRVSNLARESRSIGDMVKVAFRGGSVMGLCVGGCALLGLFIVYMVFGVGLGQLDEVSGIYTNLLGLTFVPFPMTLSGYALGYPLVAMFNRVGGGIYTKAIDMSADLAGKTEAHIPEDDPRTPATIADNVGDNVSDVAGLGSDLLESFVGAISSGVILSYHMFAKSLAESTGMTEELLQSLIRFPLLFVSVGLIACCIGIATLVFKSKPSNDPHRDLNSATYVSAALPFLFSGMLIEAVTKAARKMVDEVRRQFREIPGLLEGKVLPDYKTCIEISSKGAISEMKVPSLLAVVVPVACGFIFGPEFVGGVIIGSTVCAIMIAIFTGNAGGARDNSKKSIEAGALEGAGKGSPEHDAAVVGNTVGDPLKDTVGPCLDIFIKIMSTVALVIGTVFASHNLANPLCWNAAAPITAENEDRISGPRSFYTITRVLRSDDFRRFAARHGGLVALVHLSDGLVDDILRGLRQVDADDLVDNRLIVRARHLEELIAAGEVVAQLGRHRIVLRAGRGHKAAHDAGGRQLECDPVVLRRLRQIPTEDCGELLLHALVDVGRRARQRVGRDVELAQRLGELDDVHLQRRFQPVEHQRVGRIAREPLGDAELSGEHPLDKFEQHALLIAVMEERRAIRHTHKVRDQLARRTRVTALQKDLGRCAQDLPLHQYSLGIRPSFHDTPPKTLLE